MGTLSFESVGEALQPHIQLLLHCVSMFPLRSLPSVRSRGSEETPLLAARVHLRGRSLCPEVLTQGAGRPAGGPLVPLFATQPCSVNIHAVITDSDYFLNCF